MMKCVDSAGQLDGPAVEYYENGQIEFHCTYRNGKREGLCTTWHRDGTKFLEEEFHNGIWDGRRTMWTDGVKVEEAHYRRGVFHGTVKRWAPDGKLIEESHYRDGTLDGLQGHWNLARNRWETTEYRNDQPILDTVQPDAPDDGRGARTD